MKQTIKMIQIISVTLMTILAVQASAATEITTLRENQLQFSAGILIEDLIDTVNTNESTLDKAITREDYRAWYSNLTADRGTMNITVFDGSGDELWVYAKNIIFKGPDYVQTGVTTSVPENYNAGISGLDGDVILASQASDTRSNFYSTLQVGTGKFEESLWIYENTDGEMIIDAYKSVDFGYEPVGDQHLAINALGGDVNFFDSVAVSSRVTSGCVGVNISYQEMVAGECDIYGLKVNGSIKFNRLFGKIGDIQTRFDSSETLGSSDVTYDDQPWEVKQWNPDSSNSMPFIFDIGNSGAIRYNFAVLSQFTANFDYEGAFQAYMLVSAWNQNCSAGSGETNCPLIGTGTIRDCDVNGGTANSYPIPGSLSEEEQLHVSNLAIFDYQSGWNTSNPMYLQFAFAADLPADAEVRFKVRLCMFHMRAQDGSYKATTLRDLAHLGSKTQSATNITTMIYAMPSW